MKIKITCGTNNINEISLITRTLSTLSDFVSKLVNIPFIYIK